VTRKAQADYVAKLRETAKVERMDKPEEAATKGEAKPEAAKPADTKGPGEEVNRLRHRTSVIRRHARARPGHPRLKPLLIGAEDVDGRDNLRKDALRASARP